MAVGGIRAGRAFVEILGDDAKLRAALTRAATGVQNFGKLVSTIGGAVTAAAALGGLTATIQQFGATVSEQLQKIDEAAKVADRIGIAVEELQGLRHAASLAGSSTAGLDKALGQLSRRLGEAVTKGGETAKTLRNLGLDARQLADGSPAEAFKAIAEAISRLPTAAERANAAYQIFGRTGLELLNTLAIGRRGIDATTEALQKLGGGFSRQDAAQAEAANDAVERLSTAYEGLKNELAIGLAPAITLLTKGFTAWLATLNQIIDRMKTTSGFVQEFLRLVASGGSLGNLIGMTVPEASDTYDRLEQLEKQQTAVAASSRSEASAHEAAAEAIEEETERRKEAAEAIAAALRPGDQFVEQLRLEVETYGLARREAELYRLAMSGLTEEQARAARGLIDQLTALEARDEQLKAIRAEEERLAQAQANARREREQDAREVFEATRTPTERFETEVRRLSRLFSEGLIDPDTLGRAMEAAREALRRATRDDDALRKFSTRSEGTFNPFAVGALGGVDGLTKAAQDTVRLLQQLVGKAVPLVVQP